MTYGYERATRSMWSRSFFKNATYAQIANIVAPASGSPLSGQPTVIHSIFGSPSGTRVVIEGWSLSVKFQAANQSFYVGFAEETAAGVFDLSTWVPALGVLGDGPDYTTSCSPTYLVGPADYAPCCFTQSAGVDKAIVTLWGSVDTSPSNVVSQGNLA